MNKSVKTERSGCLALFGLPFFGVGAGFLLMSIIPTIYDVVRMQSWPSVTGVLLETKLHSGSSGDSSSMSFSAGGSTTYRVTARYRYRVAGREYTNDRVGINAGADNIGDFQRQLGMRLSRALDSGEPVTVWFDPKDPADSALNRDMRWKLLGFKMIFVIAFGGIGGGLLWIGLRGKKVIDTPEAKGRLWLQKTEWADNQIRSNARTGMYAIWAFAILWNLVSAPAAFHVVDVWREKGLLALLVLLFPMVGVGMLIWAIKRTMEWRRFGITPLRMDPFPGAVAGDVGGSIGLNMPYTSNLACEVTLSCIHSYVSGSGKNRSRHESVKWQDSGYARVVPGAGGMRLEFRFQTPAGLPDSEESGNSYHLWRLNVHAELAGVDLDRDFEIPVFSGGKDKTSSLRMLSVEERPAGVPKLTAEAIVPMTRTGNRVEVYYPMLRRPSGGVGGVVFGGVFFGIGLFLLQQAAKEGAMLYFMGGIFGLVGGLIILGGLYSLFNSLRVTFDGHSLHKVRAIAGIPVSSKQAPYTAITSIQKKKGAVTTRQGKRHRIEYLVYARTPDGNIPLAEKIDSSSKADLVVAFFRELTGAEKMRFEI